MDVATQKQFQLSRRTTLATQFGLETQENDDEEMYFASGDAIANALDFEDRFGPLLAHAAYSLEFVP